MKKIYFFYSVFFLSFLHGQNGAELYKKLQKLNTLGNVLYVAAHPDDENTRLISLFANHYNYRTAYLSMTRGDGGQNLIGTELREGLGLLRTQELIEARAIDGGEQFFTTANDFGFSKHPEETLAIWNKNEILAQIVYRIRAFKPDIIIHRFDHRTPGTTHGHHTSSALLSEQAFHLANDPNAFPEQLKEVTLWQPKRQFYNTSWWAYGSRERFEQADKSSRIAIESNPMDIIMGRSNAEVAALSRSQHKSQGFGSAPELGSQIEYLELINGEPASKNNPFSGIDTSWKRIKGGAEIEILINQMLKEFTLSEPAKILPKLISAYNKIEAIEDDYWRLIKSREVIELIQSILGLRFQFSSNVPVGIGKSDLEVSLKIVNPSPVSIQLESIQGEIELHVQEDLLPNKVWEYATKIKLPTTVTSPYWLLEKGTLGNYAVKEKNLIGLPETPNPIQTTFVININNSLIPFSVPLTYRTVDRVDGEIVENFQLLPKFTTQLSEAVIIFPNEHPKKVKAIVQAHNENARGTVRLIAPSNWKITPEVQQVELRLAGETAEFTFEITPPQGNHSISISTQVESEEQHFTYQLQKIEYPHISKQYALSPNETKLAKIDIKTAVDKIAYIKGAGDKVAESLRTIGLQVTEIEVEDIRLETLLNFPTVVLGIRAFNVHRDLSFKNQILWDFVKQGGTLIVQYNTSRGLDSQIVAPYPLTFSSDRVTDENAKVTFLEPNHPLLNSPNKITVYDFEGWVQERGLYFANSWDQEFKPLFSMQDSGETAKEGSLLVADYGKGKFIFTGLSFFRELPAGVPGAFRLFANLLSYGQ